MSLMFEVPISKSSAKHTDDFIRAATLEELKTARMVVVRGALPTARRL